MAKVKSVPELNMIDDAIKYLSGSQWNEKLPSYRPKPISQDAVDNFWETVGLLSDLRPKFNITEIGSSKKKSRIAEILNVCSKPWMRQIGFSQKVAFWTMYGMMTTAPAICYWDKFAHGTSGDNSDADISLKLIRPDSLIRLGVTSDFERDEMKVYRHRETLAWIRRAYPLGYLVNPDYNSGSYETGSSSSPLVAPQLFQSLSPQFKRIMGGSDSVSKNSVYPTAEVVEFWMNDDSVNESRQTIWVGPKGSSWGYEVAPGKKLYPRGRHVVRAGKIILHDEPNPYFMRRDPFVFMNLHGVPWSEHGLSIIKPWMDSNDILNQIMAGMLLAVKRALNPTLMAPRSAIAPESMKMIDAGKPNLKVTYNSNAITPPVWSNPPSVPGWVMQTHAAVKSAMRRSSAGDAMDSALGKKQIPGGDTLEIMSMAKTTPIRYMAMQLEGALNAVGTNYAGIGLQFYTADHRTEKLGLEGLVPEDMDDKPGSMIPEGVNSEAFVRRFTMSCEPGSLLNLDKRDKLPLALNLRKAHDISREQVLKIADLGIDLAENEQQLQLEAQKMAQAMQAAPKKGGK